MTAWSRVRRPEPSPDDPIVRLLGAALGELAPDPLFRRRLRGQLLNQFVATREGLVRDAARVGTPPRHSMGRVGRAVLVASVVLAATTATAAAASQDALPGDPLYAVKREIEDLRLQIASPSMRQTLVAGAFAERIDELDRLVAAGTWSRTGAAIEEITASGTQLVSSGLTLSAADAARIRENLTVLSALLADAPDAAQDGLAQAIAASTQVLNAAESPGNGNGGGNGNGSGGSNGNGGANGGANGNAGGNGNGGSSGNPGGNGNGNPGGDVTEPSPVDDPAPSDPGQGNGGSSDGAGGNGNGNPGNNGNADKTPKPKPSNGNGGD